MRQKLLFIVFLFTLSSCGESFLEPDGAYEMQPDRKWYRMIYNETVLCAQKKVVRTFNDIEWYLVPGYSFPVPEDKGSWAIGVSYKNRVYIAGRYIFTDWVLAHEIAHAAFEIDDHPDDPFKKCNLLTSQNRETPGAHLVR
jgi:hypothetical protein